MDMSDILGSLLRRTTSRGGKGGDALNDIFRRGSQRSTTTSRPTDIEREAKELEDLLNVANEGKASTPPRTSPQRLIPTYFNVIPAYSGPAHLAAHIIAFSALGETAGGGRRASLDCDSCHGQCRQS